MTYYKSWQEALVDFIAKYGHNFEDPYNLTTEFETLLKRNVKGAWFMKYCQPIGRNHEKDHTVT